MTGSSDSLAGQTIIDAHVHVWLRRAASDRREILESIEEVPLARVYVSGLPGVDPTAEEMAAANDAVDVLLRCCPRARGFVYLSPALGTATLEELRRCRDRGFCGIKLWQATRANDPRNFPVYEAAIQHGMPVLVHCFEYAGPERPHQTSPAALAEAARRYPECLFQMAHLGGDFISGTEAVVGLPNVYADISGTYGEHGMVEYAVQRLGADRILYGSDMPGSDVYHNLGKVLGADLSDDEKALILSRNAERVLP